MHEIDGLLLVHTEIRLPSSMLQAMQSIVNEGHLGIEKCKAIAQQNMYLPEMSRDVELAASRCTVCNAYRKQQPSEVYYCNMQSHSDLVEKMAQIFLPSPERTICC